MRFPHRGRILGQLITTLALFLLALVLGVLLLARWAMGLDDSGVQAQLWAASSCFGGSLVVLGVLSTLALRPLYRSTAAPQLLSATLRFPAIFALALLLVLLVASVAKLLWDLGVNALGLSAALGLWGATLAIGLLLVALGFILARRWTYPLIASLAREQLPPGLRLRVGHKVAFALVAVALATTLPPAVTYFGRSQQQGLRGAQLKAQQLADLLAHGTRHADRSAQLQAMASLPRKVARVSITSRPEARVSPQSEAKATNMVMAPLGDGRWLTLELPQRRTSSAGFVILLLLGVLALALLLGLDLGHSIGRDVELVTQRVSALLERPDGQQRSAGEAPHAPLLPVAPQLSELQFLANAVNELLARIAEINVGNFVSVEQILEADHIKTQFLANMSHDLKSPLNSILGFAELLDKGMEGELNPGQRDAVKIIHRNATELLHLIVEVLDAAKVEAGRMSLHRDDSLPTQFVTEALRRLRDRGAPDDVRIETELQAGMPPINVDGPRLAEALLYVLRFWSQELSEGGRVTLKATLVRNDAPPEQQGISRSAERWLRFEIGTADKSLAEERLSTLFDGFHRQPGHRGLGLGLPLARALAELHGGSLELEQAATGDRFVLLVPARQRKAIGRLRPVKV